MREIVFREWPDQVPAAEVRESRPNGQFVLGTQDDVLVLATRHQAAQSVARTHGNPQRLWLVILNEDEPEGVIPPWVKGTALSGESTVVLSPRGCGESLAWTRNNPPNYVERAHALIGRTVDTGRIHDVQSVARWLHEAEGNELTVGVTGRGRAGVLGAYAALFESSISEVVLYEPPTTHRDGPTLLNVLRVLDIPDTLGLLAPRRVTLHTEKIQSFEKTKRIFDAAGHSSRLTVHKLNEVFKSRCE